MPLAVVLALGGCSQGGWMPPAGVYRHLGDRFKVYFSPMLGVPCGVAWGERRPDELSVGQCYRFGAPRKMEGLILTYGLGGARFVQNTTHVVGRDLYWSDSGSNVVSERYQLTPQARAATEPMELRAFRVTFVGRETERFPSRSTRSIVIIDKIESVSRVPVADR